MQICHGKTDPSPSICQANGKQLLSSDYIKNIYLLYHVIVGCYHYTGLICIWLCNFDVQVLHVYDI